MAGFHTKKSTSANQLNELLSNLELTPKTTQNKPIKETPTDILNNELDKFNNRKSKTPRENRFQTYQKPNSTESTQSSANESLENYFKPNKKSQLTEFDPKKVQLKNPPSIFAVLGEKIARPFYETTNEKYWDSYNSFVSNHAIPVG